MSRPDYQRASSTNLTGGHVPRPLEGKVAIVTGGSRGIGAAIVNHLAAKGASVILTYTSNSSIEKSKSLASTLESKHNVKIVTVQADMADTSCPELIISTAKNNFSHPKTGKFQIDIIINNAGIAENLPLEELTPQNFKSQYDVNVIGPAMLVKAALPHLPHDRSGRIVNLSSVSSTLGLPGQTVYGGTKAALESMTRTWSRELAERATVNAVNPGPVATDMWGGVSEEFQVGARPLVQLTPLMAVREGVDSEQTVEYAKKLGGRPAYDYEIAGVVGMLCSDESGWCTGSVICANGGAKFSY